MLPSHVILWNFVTGGFTGGFVVLTECCARLTGSQVVPAAAVAAGDTVRWRRIFLLWRANGEAEVSVAPPALAAIIGTWMGAWPMPLDWGTAWQVRLSLVPDLCAMLS